MKRNFLACAALLAALLLSGCVEQRFIIESDPPGATVFHNGQPIGITPKDDYFIYYGDYEYVLVMPGYETLKVRQPVPVPWYEWPGLDFISENLVPWKIRDVRVLGPYALQPLQQPQPGQVLDRASQLRERGQQITPPPSSTPSPGQPPAPVAVPPRMPLAPDAPP